MQPIVVASVTFDPPARDGLVGAPPPPPPPRCAPAVASSARRRKISSSVGCENARTPSDALAPPADHPSASSTAIRRHPLWWLGVLLPALGHLLFGGSGSLTWPARRHPLLVASGSSRVGPGATRSLVARGPPASARGRRAWLARARRTGSERRRRRRRQLHRSLAALARLRVASPTYRRTKRSATPACSLVVSLSFDSRSSSRLASARTCRLAVFFKTGDPAHRVLALLMTHTPSHNRSASSKKCVVSTTHRLAAARISFHASRLDSGPAAGGLCSSNTTLEGPMRAIAICSRRVGRPRA